MKKKQDDMNEEGGCHRRNFKYFYVPIVNILTKWESGCCIVNTISWSFMLQQTTAIVRRTKKFNWFLHVLFATNTPTYTRHASQCELVICKPSQIRMVRRHTSTQKPIIYRGYFTFTFNNIVFTQIIWPNNAYSLTIVSTSFETSSRQMV